jgi:diguanylate cyclase (GGDEF)-like protein
MNNEDRNGGGPESIADPGLDAWRASLDGHATLGTDQTLADNDQSSADADQTAADADQTASEADQAIADIDQRASDRDQATADREHAAGPPLSAADETAYGKSRDDRDTASFERLGSRLRRQRSAHDRDISASTRDGIAHARDEASRARDARASEMTGASSEPETTLLKRLEELAAAAAADRARAAADRARAALDRANAARERERLEAELREAHLDELTGAYRREMGRLALSNEIDRARRSDGRFVLAFVDVDGLKSVNDREGHAAGDRVLQTVVRTIRTRLRSFDPIMRYGGDEFVCGLGGTDVGEAERRFGSIGVAIESDAGVGISVGLAALAPGDNADVLTERADAEMLKVKARHHARS